MPRVASAECCCGFEMEGRPQPQERDGIARGQGEREGREKEERERGRCSPFMRNETGPATEQQRDGARNVLEEAPGDQCDSEPQLCTLH